MVSPGSEFDLDFSDLDDPLEFLDSPSWSQRLRAFANKSRNYFRKWYYVTPFQSGIELETWNDVDLDSVSPDLQSDYFRNSGTENRNSKKAYIWKWITFVLMIISLLLLSILIVSSVKNKKRRVHGAAAVAMSTGVGLAKTLIISLDGFHPGYISESRTPFLNQIFSSEANSFNDTIVAPYMVPSFPSQTFPNHWSMVTGQFPHHHGIIANRFWDQKQDLAFQIGDLSSRMNTFWNRTLPIWYFTNENELQTHTHMWPGSEIVHEDPLRNPTIIDPFNIYEPLNDKLVVIQKALQNESTALTFAYVPVVDTMGHKYGNLLDSGHSKVLKEVDDFIEQLLSDIDPSVNVVIVSDHGMSTILKKNVYVWEDHFGDVAKYPSIAKLYDDVNTLIYTKDGKDSAVDELYRELQPKVPPVCELMKSTDLFPDVRDPLIQNRIPQLVITCDPGYLIVTREKYDKLPARFGNHGFRRDEPDMRALFMGKGPFFEHARSKLKLPDQYIKPFDNIQIFSLLLNLCGIDVSGKDIDVDADLKFWDHLMPLGKYSESSPEMLQHYPDSEYNKLWNTYEEEASAPTTPTTTTTTPSTASTTTVPTSTTSSTSTTDKADVPPSLGDIIDEVESTINDIIHKIWPSKGKGNHNGDSD